MNETQHPFQNIPFYILFLFKISITDSESSTYEQTQRCPKGFERLLEVQMAEITYTYES